MGRGRVLMEPDWRGLSERLMRMTMRQLRKVGGRWFSGMMGGASAKGEYVQTMVGQMRYWWLSCVEEGGRERVGNVLKTIIEIEEVANG